MPLYEYKCNDCGVVEKRVGGLDDHVALCVDCGGLMLRNEVDTLRAYFDEARKKQAETT